MISHSDSKNKTLMMVILNVTPDSFSDGGQFINPTVAIQQVKKMLADGADIIDIGGESTRPGAKDVSVEDELNRVVPIIKAIREFSDCLISVDTSKAVVMREAVSAGANIINDVRALQEEHALETVAELDVPVCLMHMQGQPRTMQQSPEYDDVVNDVGQFLLARTKVCEEAGIAKDKILFDPGYGFGKSLEHNYTLVKHLPSLMKLGYPVLVGMSRKSMIGNLLNRKVDERLAGSISLATIVAQMGAQIIRVHDVKETADAVNIVKMLNSVK